MFDKDIVVKYFGGYSATARALHIKHPSVINWPQVVPFSAVGKIAWYQPDAFSDLRKIHKILEDHES